MSIITQNVNLYIKEGIEIFDKKITLKSINDDSIKLYENPGRNLK